LKLGGVGLKKTVRARSGHNSRGSSPSLKRAASCLPILSIALLLSSSGGAAADPNDAVRSAVAAHGGAESIVKGETLGKRTGSYTQFYPAKNTGTFTEWKKGDKVLIEVQLAGLELVQGYDGSRAWVRSLGQIIDAPEQIQTAIEEENRHNLTLLTDVEGYTVEAVEPDSTLDGVQIQGVRVSPVHGGPSTDFHFHHETGRVAKISFTDVNPYMGDQAYFETYILEYSDIGDVLFPSKTVHFIDGIQMDEVIYESVDFDVEIADAMFIKPTARGFKDRAAGDDSGDDDIRVEVPLDYSLDLLFVDVTIDDAEKRYSFILDTGAGMTCLSKELAEELDLQTTGGMSAAGAGGALDAKTGRVDRLSVGDMTVEALDVMVIDIAPMSEMMGRRIDGIIGYNVLNRYSTTIDIAGESLVFESSDAPLPSGDDFHSLPFQVLMGVPMVEGTVDGEETIDFLVDTGATTSVLPKAVAEKLGPTEPLEGGVVAGADSREMGLAVARFDELALGGAVADDPVFSYPLTSERNDPLGFAIDTANRGIIGTAILRDFRVTLNYDRATMVFQPVDLPEDKSNEWCGPGVNVYMDRGGIIVRSVFKEGPADELIEEGDRVLEIDGKSVDGMDLEQVVAMLRGEPGTNVEITIDRSGVKKTIVLERVRLL
jgi:predicted aspartyl protease